MGPETEVDIARVAVSPEAGSLAAAWASLCREQVPVLPGCQVRGVGAGPVDPSWHGAAPLDASARMAVAALEGELSPLLVAACSLAVEGVLADVDAEAACIVGRAKTEWAAGGSVAGPAQRQNLREHMETATGAVERGVSLLLLPIARGKSSDAGASQSRANADLDAGVAAVRNSSEGVRRALASAGLGLAAAVDAPALAFHCACSLAAGTVAGT